MLMKLPPNLSKAIVVLLALMLGACALNEPRVNQFADFADAGTTYTSSVTSLLDASLLSAIEADNAVLMRTREFNQDQELLELALNEHEKATRDREEVLDKIRLQTRLLDDYFAALGLLASRADDSATAKAMSGLTEATEKLAGELGTLSDTIAEAKIRDKPVSDFLGSVSSLVIDSYQRQALDRILEATAEPVRRSLNVHHAALKAIREQMEDERQLIAEWNRTKLINRPYLGGKTLPANWGANRRASLMDKGDIRKVDQAVAASKKLEKAFEKLLSTDADGLPFKLLIQDLKGLAAAAKQVV